MHILLFIFVFLFTSHSNAAGYSRDNLSYISHIQNEIIHEIAVEKNYVWCATENGIIRYDKRDGEIKRYTTTDGLGSNVISSLAIDNNGVKWFGTADSKGVMSFDGKTWESYYQSYMQGVYVSSIVIDKNNIKYFSFAKGVYRFDGNSWELINVNNPRRVFVDSNDNIWMMFDGNIFLSQNGGDFKEIFPPVPQRCPVRILRTGL
jgi:ligand-binding sensor domain-containing protein